MREIKFRAWDEEQEIMQPYALIYTARGGEPETLDDAIDIAEHRYKLLQYTGLKDRNGVEIYEGDILRREDWGQEEVNTPDYGLVVWLENEARFALNTYRKGKYIVRCIEKNRIMAGMNEFEIISNIYENPELLQE